MEWLIDLEMAFRVAVALILGGLVGLERELQNKAAGLRTHMLVTGAAALFTCLGDILIHYYAASFLGTGVIRADPTRLIQAIVLGVGFIGAGTIIQREEEARVKNLTTAGSILFTSAIGIAAGLGRYYLAVWATVLQLIVVGLVGKVEKRYMKEHRQKNERRENSNP